MIVSRQVLRGGLTNFQVTFGIRMAAIVLATNFVAAPSLRATTTSYHVGNSLTEDSQPLSLSAFAALRDREHTAGYHIFAGASLNSIVAQPDHPNVTFEAGYGRFDAALPGNVWTAVTMQSHTGATSTLGTDVASMVELIDLTRSNPANAATKFYIYAGWPTTLSPYQSQWTAAVVDSPSTPSVRARDYYDHLINRVRAETDAEVYMIPVGEVLSEIDLLIQQGELPGFFTVRQFYRDALHLNVAYGRYLAAATTFATLLSEEPRGLTRPDGWFRSSTPISEDVITTINETIRRVLNASPYSGVNFDPPLADFDDSGMVDSLDLALWHGATGKTAVGDADGDNIVDGTDFLAWQRRLGSNNRLTENFDPEDVNKDGLVDGGELLVWRSTFAAGAGYDMDADGDTDGADFLTWQRSVTPTLPEDFDRDSTVNGGDLPLWQENFGFNIAADANGDGLVDDADYLIWQREEGRVWPLPKVTMAGVPEPAGLALAGLGGIMATAFLRSRANRPSSRITAMSAGKAPRCEATSIGLR